MTVNDSDADISLAVSMKSFRTKIAEAGLKVEHESQIKRLLELMNIQLIVLDDNDVVMVDDSDIEQAASAAETQEAVAAEKRDLARLQSIINDKALKSAVMMAIRSSEMNAKISPDSYRLVSHYILAMLTIKCFIRSITLSSLTLKDFLSHISTKHYVLIRNDNGSFVVLDHLDFFLLRSYVSILRPVLPTDSLEPHRSRLMITQGGKPFSDVSVISCQFQKKHSRDATFKPVSPTEASKACIQAYIEAGKLQ